MAEAQSVYIKVGADKLANTRAVKQLISDNLLRYSEWLDADQHLTKKPKKNDHRTWEDLVSEFLSDND